MIFVGGGALLVRAVEYARHAGIAVDAVCCSKGDSSIPTFRKSKAPLLETDDPSTTLLPLLRECRDRIALSINNKYILHDRLLTSGVSFFNVHNGLIQQYRGVAAVCVFAGLCKRERRYGVTLHRIVPGRDVDSGPVVAQLAFAIGENDLFSDVMKESLDTCQRIFELNIEQILRNRYTEQMVHLSDEVYTYNDVSRICAEADAAALARASSFGPYAHFFPKLKSIVESVR